MCSFCFCFVFNLSSSCVLCAWCYLYIWIVHSLLQLHFCLTFIFFWLYAEHLKFRLFSFDVAEMLLLFGTIRKASSPPWLLIVQGIFKNIFRTNECEVTRGARNNFLRVLKKRCCFLEWFEIQDSRLSLWLAETCSWWFFVQCHCI